MLNQKLEGMYLHKIKNRYNEIGRYVYSNVTPIEGIQIRETEEFERYQNAVKAPGFAPIRVGDNWGGGLRSGWFKMSFTLPESFAGKPACALIDIGFEGLVFLGGVPHQGIETWWHKEVLLSESAEAGKSYDLVVEAMYNWAWMNRQTPAELKQAETATINREVEACWYSLGFLMDLANALPENSVRRARIIYGLNQSVNTFDLDRVDEESLRKSAQRAAAVIQPLLEEKAEASALELTCCGHSHIDTAWLWPYDETIRKCGRTFSTVMRLMEQYPDYHFSQSQPQLYEFTKERWPELYREIKKRAKEGRWEPIGCMWVEADTNIPSGESLVRQTLFGKRFFQEEFGVETKVLWLPDVFGYSGSLPQILKKAGVDYFTSIKLLWGNQFNRLPYHSFWWQGIDGTRILAHFPPHGDYNTRIDPKILRLAQENYVEKDRSGHALYQFGHGDGGGGPEKAHLERLKLAKDLEGLPRCVQRRGAEFFEDLAAEAHTFPTWRGELYFELHRGTYTTQGRTKRNNRRAELLLRDAEMLSVGAMALGASYPAENLMKAWKLMLKNQFHDVIPGSSVPAVYVETEADYKEVFRLAGDAAAGAMEFIADKIDTSGRGRPVVVFNTLSWARDSVATVPLPDQGDYSILDGRGAPIPSQLSSGGKALSFFARVPPAGYATYRLVKRLPQSEKGLAVSEAVPEGYTRMKTDEPQSFSVSAGIPQDRRPIADSGPQPESSLTVSPALLENRFFRIELDADGLITSIYDKKAGRQVMPDGAKGNLLQLFEDKPNDFDAWDIDFHYTEKGEDITGLESVEVDELGPVSGSLRLVRRFSGSTLEQRIVIYSDIPRIDFITHVDWHEEHKVLKAAFPAAINSPNARYEVQFGNLERPTHTSTSWDFARFEVCGHKWADLSEGDYGVSLMNDCKYGYHITENLMRLTLLRAATDPDPTADIGEHDFTYSLYPHQGDYKDGGVVRAGYELNVPLRTLVTAVHSGLLPPQLSMFALGADGVVLDTVKKAEDDDSVILRFYEAHNGRGRVTLSTQLLVKEASECDLMEREIGKLDAEQGAVRFDIAPFEIKTIKLNLE